MSKHRTRRAALRRMKPGNAGGMWVVLVGAGGNIGSHLVPHMARMPGVARMTLVEPDTYEAKNVVSQDIVQDAVGKRKVNVQARRAHQINPRLRIDAIADRVENVPWGQLQGDLMLTGLDSQLARKHVSRIATRLGMIWVDAGVRSADLIGRIQVFRPGPDACCLECGWDKADYDAAAEEHPCVNGRGGPVATNGISGLGGLVAGLVAIECSKLVQGQLDQVAFDEVMIVAGHHRHLVSRCARNPNCQFDHQVWEIDAIDESPAQLTVAQAMRLAGRNGRQADSTLRVEGKRFVTALMCGCGAGKRVLRLEGRLGRRDLKCRKCGEEMRPLGATNLESLRASALPERLMARSLASAGFRPGDVVTVCRSGDAPRHVLIGHDRL